MVAVCCPRWRGVSASTERLFSSTFFLPSDPLRTPQSLSGFEVNLAADEIVLAEPDVVVFSGAIKIFSI